uniref:Protein arginine N-methyltransferase 5 n=1 Tax=Aceria tosichella TaxID=561515 RepID=A0A6G1SFJ5_9ACAR
MKFTTISNSDPEKFVSCRVGLEFANYFEDLGEVLNENGIYGLSKRGIDYQDPNFENYSKGNFIVVPITPPRSNYYDSNNDDESSYHLLPDLVLAKHRWENEIVISISQAFVCSGDNQKAIERFDRLFSHSLYLPAQVIVIDMPATKETQKVLANIINERLKTNHSQRLFLFRVGLTPFTNRLLNQSSSRQQSKHVTGGGGASSRHNDKSDSDTIMITNEESSTESGYGQCSSQSSSTDQDPLLGGWEGWNHFRSHLVPDHRIGICLLIDNDMENEDIEDTNRWKGEPIRMVVMSADRFTFTKGFKNTMRPAGGIKEFIKMIAVSNSMMTSFVVQSRNDCDAREQLDCLSGFCDYLQFEFPDFMRAWDDALLDPLQPLSNNLDSNTYNIFEQDKAKYSKYHEAMLEALGCLLARPESRYRTRFTLMILGAGRGPLVDAMISAIHKLKVRGKIFKIYALDKNHSSIVSLKYKKLMDWDIFAPTIETEIIASDMREWMPVDKADIIATELLGSFSDNELSPECIDGTWRFSTSQTISIPQSYSSYLAPICSFRMRQELQRASLIACNQNSFDKIQVVRLRNYYLISDPKRLFTFEHKRLDMVPLEGGNRREAILTFSTHVDSTCHGFAGFFSAQLFGKVHISTNPSTKTPTMESWFPVYVPIEEPFFMPAGSSIDVKFSRKETDDRVWYEWQILKPKPSRIHCKDGVAASMSKII